MRLLLMRHAEAAAMPGTPDHDRPLTRRGESDALAMARWLQANVPEISIVMCSTATRAMRTCELVLGELVEPPTPMYSRSLYRAGSDDLLELLQTAADHDVLLVIGHNPAISQAADVLAGETLPVFPAGAIAMFGVSPRDTRLLSFVTP